MTKRYRSAAALLDAGERLFTERGWEATRLADVATEAGVSAATLYNHFPSTYVLVGRIFAQVYAPLERRAQRLRQTAPSVPEAIAAHVRALAALTREYRGLGEQVTVLLFLRCFTRPSESAGESADIILTMLFGAVRPELLERPGVPSMCRPAP